MGMTTENSAQKNAQPEKRKQIGSSADYVAGLADYYLVMHFADKLLESRALSEEEYTRFSVETAQVFMVQILSNPSISTADRTQNPRHNNG